MTRRRDMEDPEKRAKIIDLVRRALSAETPKDKEAHLSTLILLFQDAYRFPLDAYSGYRDGPEVYTVFFIETGVIIGQGLHHRSTLETIEVYARGQEGKRLDQLRLLTEETLKRETREKMKRKN